jgi:hypothetical protein
LAAHCSDEQKSADTALLIGVLAKIGFSPNERGRMEFADGMVKTAHLIQKNWSQTT